MIIKDGKRYYPIEIERIVSVDSGIIYDRELWRLKCPLAECNGRKLRDSQGAVLMISRYNAPEYSEYVSAYSGEQIDNFIKEVLS